MKILVIHVIKLFLAAHNVKYMKVLLNVNRVKQEMVFIFLEHYAVTPKQEFFRPSMDAKVVEMF